MLKRLLAIMQQMRNTNNKDYVNISTTLAIELEIKPNFPEKHKRKRMLFEFAKDEG